MPAPLNGLRVVDFGQGIAGPLCGQLLADFGADVIKVEPLRGDWIRPLGARDAMGQSGAFIAMNRNKRAICLDLKSERGRRIGRALSARADVVVQNFRPSVMDRLGLAYDDLASENKKLIFCSVSGFGSAGPYAELRSGDTVMQALAGLMSIVGERGGQPLRVNNVVSDMVAGNHAFSGILLALLRRSVTGVGGRVDVALMDTMMAFQASPLTEFLISGVAPVRNGNRHALISPSGAFKTQDSYMAISVLEHQWDGFCEDLGLVEQIRDPKFRDNESRMRNRDELNAKIESILATRPTTEWVRIFGEKGVQCAPINDYPTLARDPQVKFRQILFEIEKDGHRVPMIRNPVNLDGTPIPYTMPPKLGEHSEQVLREDLGLDESEVAELLKARIVVADGEVKH